jgi:mRNA interferase MazF
MLQKKELRNSVLRGEVYWVNLPLSNKSEDKNIRELQGRHPALVISNDEQNKFSPLITILPLTSQVDKIYPFQVFSKLKGKNGIILVDQIRTIDRKRFSDKLGELSLELMEQVERALHITLALKN